MPKKFHGENSKASVARARKEATKQAEVEKKKQEEEDALWKDDDKHAVKKMQRKEERDKKKQEVLERKLTSKQLLEEEMSSIKSAKPAAPAKLTQAQIQAMQEAQAAEKAKAPKVITEEPLEENINRLVVDGVEARSVEEAIAVLSVGDNIVLDRHPEKRMKAAYTAFEEANLPRLKAENPNMRLSQLKQMLKKDWQKSPENPLNQVL